jgi:hypothetical protein
VFHRHRKHIAIRYHFIRELVETRKINLEFCKSEEQLADIFTKTLPKENFEKLREYLGLIDLNKHLFGAIPHGDITSLGKSNLRGGVEDKLDLHSEINALHPVLTFTQDSC